MIVSCLMIFKTDFYQTHRGQESGEKEHYQRRRHLIEWVKLFGTKTVEKINDNRNGTQVDIVQTAIFFNCATCEFDKWQKMSMIRSCDLIQIEPRTQDFQQKQKSILYKFAFVHRTRFMGSIIPEWARLITTIWCAVCPFRSRDSKAEAHICKQITRRRRSTKTFDTK